MSERTTIPLSRETRDLLKDLGKKGETWDALVRRLIREVQEK